MSKRLNRKFSISRRIGAPMWGDKKDPYNKKNYPPGAHGVKGYRKKTEFGNQLLSKQKLRFYYGYIRESQFRKIFIKARKIRGNTSENIITLLESRLDVFVYRCNFTSSIFSAKQLVSHKHILVNDKIVNVGSYNLNINDIVKIKDNSRYVKYINKNINRKIPNFISINNKNEATYVNKPLLCNISYPIKLEPNYVVEFYSR